MARQADGQPSKRRNPGGVASSSSANNAGPTHLVIGRIVAPFGIRGEVKVRIETDDPDRFTLLDSVYLGKALRPYAIESSRIHQGNALLHFRGVDDRTAAEELRGQYVYVAMKDALPLEEGEYYVHQIEGLATVTAEGERLGTIREVLQTGANDVYVVEGPKGEILLPAIADVILGVDLDAGTITVRIPDGLL
jgi:16S rRNA processing protein RimM